MIKNKLKKIFLVTTIFTVITSGTFAANVGFSLGANLLGGGNFGSVRAGDLEKIYGTTDSISNLTGGFDLNAQIDFKLSDSQAIILRPTLDFIFNNGVGNGFKFTYENHTIGTSTQSDCKISMTTIDFSLLAGYKYSFSEKIAMDFYVGPYISFPVSGNVSFGAESYKANFVSPNFGATAGLDGIFKVGIGEITAGAGYKFDFMATSAKVNNAKTSIYARRNIFANVGYRFILK